MRGSHLSLPYSIHLFCMSGSVSSAEVIRVSIRTLPQPSYSFCLGEKTDIKEVITEEFIVWNREQGYLTWSGVEGRLHRRCLPSIYLNPCRYKMLGCRKHTLFYVLKKRGRLQS